MPTIRDIAQAESEFFLKSTYGPVSASWPAMSYTMPMLKMHLDREYRAGSDFVLLAGTTGPETRQEYRGRLASVLRVDLTKSYRTQDLISPESWQRTQRDYPGLWGLSLGVLKAWTFAPPPRAAEKLPESYAVMGQYPYRGSVRKIVHEERSLIWDLEIVEEVLPTASAMDRASTIDAMLQDRVLNEEAVRIAGLIINRVRVSGTLQSTWAPRREAPTDLIFNIAEQLRRQPLYCALCGGPMTLLSQNKLLQISADRKDSARGDYGPENFQLAHLACNLAKNDATEAQFQEWLGVAVGG